MNLVTISNQNLKRWPWRTSECEGFGEIGPEPSSWSDGLFPSQGSLSNILLFGQKAFLLVDFLNITQLYVLHGN